jgi:hypothetical protein
VAFHTHERRHIVRIRSFLLVAAAGTLVSACADDPVGPTAPGAAPAPPRQALDQAAILHPFADRRTPFQRSVMQFVADRRAAGLPVPDSLSFSFDDRPAAAPGAMLRLEDEDAEAHPAGPVHGHRIAPSGRGTVCARFPLPAS